MQLYETDANIRSSLKYEHLSHRWHFQATNWSKHSEWIDGQVIDWTCWVGCLQHYRPFGGCKYRQGKYFCRHCGRYLQKLPLLQIFVDNPHCHFSLWESKSKSNNQIYPIFQEKAGCRALWNIWYHEREHRWLIARQNRSLMIIAARNRALMTTCAVNCRSQVRQMSVYRVLRGDYGGGIGGMKVL